MSKSLGSKKTGGRKKGTPNKKTLGLEEALAKNNLNVVDKISELLSQLSVDKQIDTLMEMMSYLYPKRKAVESYTEAIVKNEKSEMSEVDVKKQLEEAKEKAISVARRLVILDMSTEEHYIKSKIEEELSQKKAHQQVSDAIMKSSL